MIYPDFLKQGDTIGVTAPSDGNKKEIDFKRLAFAAEHLREKGFLIKETPNVRTSVKGRSSSKEDRAEQLMDLVTDPSVRAVISAKGGDYLMEVLSLLDYKVLRENPKWMQGYSDNTGLLFTVTTLCDIATLYTNHYNDFAMEPWHPSVENNMAFLQGDLRKQQSFDKFEDGFYDKETGKEGYTLTGKVCWINARGEEEITVSGRLLGGCLDVLLNLVGTRFDAVEKFVQRYEKDGILWFLESFDLNSEELARGLWQLKEAGWFAHCKGFVFGRPCMFESFTDTTYREAMLSVLDELEVPMILDTDIGHKGPQFCVMNGALGTFHSKDGKGSLVTELG